MDWSSFGSPERISAFASVVSAIGGAAAAGAAFWSAGFARKAQRAVERIELYPRRLAVYKAIDAFYGQIPEAGQGSVSFKMAEDLRVGIAEAQFLFGKDKKMKRHLEELCSKAREIVRLQQRLSATLANGGLPVGEERSKVVDEHSELVQWIQGEARDESRRLFGKYLRLN